MPIGTGAAILGSAALGAASSAMNKPKNGGTTITDPYANFPEIPDAIKKTILPQAGAIASRPYPKRPMMRAADPSTDPFASRALFQLQQARDAERVAGAGRPATPQPAAGSVSPSALDMMQKEMLGLQTAPTIGGPQIGNPKDTKTRDYIQGLMQNQGLKRFYTLTPEQQSMILAGNVGQVKGQFGIDPFSY